MLEECLLDDCNKPVRARGLCASCYSRADYWGKLDEVGLPKVVPTRFEIPQEKECTTCGLIKPESDYRRMKYQSVHNGVVEYLFAYCDDCEKLRKRASNRTARRLKNGWSSNLFEKVLELQNGLCAIDGCDNVADAADHDHDTGEPRAILCGPCNRALGLLKESPERIAGLLLFAKQCQNSKLWMQ